MRPSNRPRLLLFSLLALASVSCDQSFDPRAPFSEIPVVYSVLANDKTTQYVRMYTTYDPNQPGAIVEKPIIDALVTISDGTTTYTLVDTTLQRPDTSRYQTPIHAYAVSGLNVNYGRTFNLQIQSPSVGNLAASFSTPIVHYLSVGTESFLDHPRSSSLTKSITLTARTESKGYCIRACLDYEVLEDSTWVQFREEIPVGFKTGQPPSVATALYSPMQRNPGANVQQKYNNEAYLILLYHLFNSTQPRKLVFKQVVFLFIQLEEHLYGYYGTVSGFNDPFTTRLDSPNYSNIQNGAGVFGGYMVDSATHVLPTTFELNRR